MDLARPPRHDHAHEAPTPGSERWDALIRDPRSPDGVDDLEATVGGVFAALAARGPAGLDFSGIDPRLCHPEHLACALRACGSLSEAIPSWEAGLLCAIDACALRGVDARELLAGLL